MSGWEIATFICAFLALVVAVLALLFSAPFYFDRVGWPLWAIRYAPPAPRRVFAPGSREYLELQQIRIYAKVITMMAMIQNSEKTTHSIPDLREELDKLDNFKYKRD